MDCYALFVFEAFGFFIKIKLILIEYEKINNIYHKYP